MCYNRGRRKENPRPCRMKGMTQMEEFLTRKAKNRIWEIPVLAVLGLFIAAGISIVGDDMRGRMTSTDVIADAVVMFLFAFPFFRIVIRRVRVRYARQIGHPDPASVLRHFREKRGSGETWKGSCRSCWIRIS